MDRSPAPDPSPPDPRPHDARPHDSAPTAGAAADAAERLLASCLAQADGDVAERIEAACQRFPEHAVELRARLRLLEEVGFFGGNEVPAQAAIPERLGGFQLLRRIGSGGMGVVYLAREEALDRTVALKLVRPEHLYFPESLERFRREVKVVAGLRHPGIVPVFAVGETQGIPYFTMECVAGANLQQVLGRLHALPPERLTGGDLARVLAELVPEAGVPAAEEGARSLGGSWQEVCVRLVLQVAEALAYVHGHGILHRDVKPANLMVTPAGRVMLLDFGLSVPEGAGRLTRSGALAGSLPYMSPEQLRGVAALDARTDVYSLGVTLYELLTLQCPHLRADGEATRKSIQEGIVPALREHNRAVTWDAETVCQKAMDRDPERRYATAQELARDLRNVLEYRPITARRPGALLRVRRFAQRRPALAVGAALGSLVVFGAPIAWAVLEHGAALRIETQRAQAEANLGEALKAVNQMLTRVGGSRLKHVPQSTDVRRELLLDALEFCRRLRAERPSHAGIRREMAKALVQSSVVQRGLGDREHAEQSLLEAIREFHELVQQGTDPRQDALDLAASERSLGSLLNGMGRMSAAEEWARRALARCQELCKRFPEDQDAQRERGEALATLVETLIENGKRPEAATVATEAVAVLSECVASKPGDHTASRSLAFALFGLGDVRVRGKTSEGEAALRRAVTLAGDLVKRFPDNEEDLELLAVAEGRLGLLLQNARQLPEAELVNRSVITHRQRLVAAYPGWVSFHVELGGALSNLGSVVMLLGRPEEASDLHRQAIEAQRRALAISPNHVGALEFLHIHRSNLARALLRLGKPDEVLALADQSPDAESVGVENLMYRADLLSHCMKACQDHPGLADGDRAETVESLGRRAVACLEGAVAAGMHDPARLQVSTLAVLRRRPDYRALVTKLREDAGARGK